MKRFLLFITILCAFNFSVNAQYYEWVGGSGDWGDPNNWEDEFGDPGLPGYGADVYIGGSDAYVYYDPQFTDFYNSIIVYDYATLSSADAIYVFNEFHLDEFSQLELYLTDVNFEYDGSVEVLSGTYDIQGKIIPNFIGSTFVPQIGDDIIVANASGTQNGCGAFLIENAIQYDNGNSMFEVAYTVVCNTSNQIVIHINDINYTGAISWDGEAGNSQWSTPENWDPNGIPTPDDYVIINKNGGSSVITGGVSQDRISLGKNNTLTITGNIELSHPLKVIETASLNWSSGALQKRLEGNFPTIANWGLLTVNGVSLEDIGTIANQNNGIIEMNGDININNGRIFNINGGTININSDNLTIGYTSSGEHRLYNSSYSTLEKTATSGPGTSSINLTDFQNAASGTIRSEQGTLAIGENFNNQGIVTGSGYFSFPNDFVMNGIVSPGSSPGVLTIIGNLTCGPIANFDIEIDGPTAGTGYDQIIVTNNAVLEGTISVTLGYLPANDASFEIVTAGTLTSCNFPAQVTSNFNGTDYTFNVVCQNNVLYLLGPGATLSNPDFEASELDVYPNPVSDILNIRLSQQVEGRWVLFNQIGQLVLEGDIIDLETSININSLVSGFYALQIKDGRNNTVKIKKIIVTN